VGTMNPGIEIWNLDVLDEVEPAATLRALEASGGPSRPLPPRANPPKGKSKGGIKLKGARAAGGKKGAGVGGGWEEEGEELKPGSHTGAVMCVTWNHEFRNVLASGGRTSV